MDKGIILPRSGDLTAGIESEIAELQRSQAQAIELGHLGLCADCPRVATKPCPDGWNRCDDHTLAFARKIMAAAKERDRFVHRLSPAGKKARAKRRLKRKAAR